MPILASLFGSLGLSQAVSRVLGVIVPLGLAALLLAFLWARGDHYMHQRDAARAQVETLNAKLAVSNASIATLEKSLAAYVGASKAAKTAQLASIEAQAKDNAALQAQADAIRKEVAGTRAAGCDTPKAVREARGL